MPPAAIVPGEVVESPQSMVAVKSETVPAGFASVKPNVSGAAVTPATPGPIVSVPAVSGASATTAEPVAEVVAPPTLSTTVTLTVKVPSSA